MCWTLRRHPPAARYAGAGHARVLEGYAAAVRRAVAPGARQQDRRANHRLRGHRPPGTAADVGQGAARLPDDGVPRRGATGIWRNQRYMWFNNGFILISWGEPSGIRRQHLRRPLCTQFLRQIKPSVRQFRYLIAPGDHHVRTHQRSSVTTLS